MGCPSSTLTVPGLAVTLALPVSGAHQPGWVGNGPHGAFTNPMAPQPWVLYNNYFLIFVFETGVTK